MLIFWFYFVTAAFGINLSASSEVNETNRESRNFGRHQPNYETCSTQSGLRGICMKRSECIQNNGIAAGFCGTYGVCCEMNLACNAISRMKRTVVRNPVPLPTRCTYHFQPFSPNVCQLRIDFDIVLSQPVVPDGMNNAQSVICVNDIFQIGDLRLCGANLNQHIYVPFDVAGGTGDVSLSFTLSNRNQNQAFGAYWSMVVTQLECPPSTRQLNQNPGGASMNSLKYFKSLLKSPNNDVDLVAPQGCLQFFTENQGTFESFNYNNGQGPYLANLRYGICFRRTPLDTGVQLSASTFEIGAAAQASNFIDNDCHDILGTPARSNDYLLVPESVLATNPPSYGTFYCGRSLQSGDLLLDPPGPFVIYFNSDNIYSTLVPERGFRIAYTIQ